MELHPDPEIDDGNTITPAISRQTSRDDTGTCHNHNETAISIAPSIPELEAIGNDHDETKLETTCTKSPATNHTKGVSSGISLPKLTIQISRSFKKDSSIRFGVGPSSCLYGKDGNLFCTVTLPPGLPKTEFLNTKNTLNDRLYEIYLKYIKTGSDQEINISHDQRHQITESFQRFEEQMLTNDQNTNANEKVMIKVELELVRVLNLEHVKIMDMTIHKCLLLWIVHVLKFYI